MPNVAVHLATLLLMFVSLFIPFGLESNNSNGDNNNYNNNNFMYTSNLTLHF